MFKIGDRVRLIKNGAMRAQIGATATITGFSNGYVVVKWDRDELSLNQNNGAYWVDYFELYRQPKPNSFSITLKFLSVDDAIKAATHLAPTYGPMRIEPEFVE